LKLETRNSTLAPYALHSEESRGRRHPEPPHPYRQDFQRDRDRIIHARAFRRLENKTQVFTRRYSDHFRNRLTHTIEVAQIARTVAAELELNVDLVETLALAHDIGHPPFGHAGENALDREMRKHGEGFDHNLHALRIVEYFEERYATFRGLNLTFEVREGLIKHSRRYSAQEFPELSEYLLELRPPLEAQLIDLADEIAYNTADLDDGVEAGILSIDQIRNGVDMFERAYQEVERAYPSARPKLKFYESIKRMVDRFAGDLITNSRNRIQAAGVEDSQAVREFPEMLAAFSPQVEAERRQAKQFLREHLYESPDLREHRKKLEQVISDLFRFWMAHPEQLPTAYREELRSESQPRIICDYIAGMTDNFILDQHRQLCA
jgi:dGTPase